MSASAAISEESWMSTSDLMAGLMIIFLFVAIAYIKGIGQEQKMVEESICSDLQTEFENVSWRDRMEICSEPLVVRFTDPDTLFEKGEARLTQVFEGMLSEFFPRYMNVLSRNFEHISEVRIEGHTDESWRNEVDRFVMYFNNMGLSQRRTRSVMSYALGLREVREHEDWVIRNMTANGMSSSRPIFEDESEEYIDPELSRRVEFRIRLKPPKSLSQITSQE